MGYYPIFVEMAERPVLLVGGGHVALEKIGKLVDADARVTVVAPELIPEVRAFIEGRRAEWLPRRYEQGDVHGYKLVMIATDDGEVNARIAAEARAAGIWVNAADDVDNCDFILPSLARRGRVALAASTGGSSPALARWLRERLEEFLTDEVEALAELLADVRVEVRERDHACAATCEEVRTPPPLLCATCPSRIPADRWQEAIDPDLRALLRGGAYDEARTRLRLALGLDGSPPQAAPAARAPEADRRGGDA